MPLSRKEIILFNKTQIDGVKIDNNSRNLSTSYNELNSKTKSSTGETKTSNNAYDGVITSNTYMPRTTTETIKVVVNDIYRQSKNIASGTCEVMKHIQSPMTGE